MSPTLSNILKMSDVLALLLGLGHSAAALASWPGLATYAVTTCTNGELAEREGQ